jgi:hypothetical protein
VGKKAVVTDCDAHHRRTKVKEEHTKLEPIDSKMIEIDRSADKGDKGCADKETGSDPVHAVKGDTKHNFILSLLVAGNMMRHRADS